MGIIKFILKFGKILLKLLKVLAKLGLINEDTVSMIGIDPAALDLSQYITL